MSSVAAAVPSRANKLPHGHSTRIKQPVPQLLTASSLDGRTKVSRRLHELARKLAGPSPTERRQIFAWRAANLTVMIEDMETRANQGETIDEVIYATLLNAQRRALKET
jgi:hypothetical protein